MSGRSRTISSCCSGTAEPAHWLPNADASAWPPPAIAREHVAAIAFTSGSTGEPQAHLKTWGGVVDGARAEVMALQLDDAPMDDVVLIGTVSPQHMYGFESTVLMALHGPCAFAAEHPLHPDEVRARDRADQRPARADHGARAPAGAG